jgi:hypothetical protein
MPFFFREKSWRISYSSNENNPIADFYIPALECAVQYDRKSGFFNSAILSKVARGLGAMLHNEGKMRLIMGCQFSRKTCKPSNKVTNCGRHYSLASMPNSTPRELRPTQTL